MNKSLYSICLLILCVLAVTGCNKTLRVDPTHIVPEKNMWQVKNDARSAVFATYGLLRAALAEQNAYLAYGELRAGDFNSSTKGELMALHSNSLDVTSSVFESWKSWQRFYAVIAQANTCLEKLPKVAENDFRYTEDNMNLDIANVRFVRAMAYFYLVRIWGDVPINTLPIGVDQKFPRQDWHKVLDFARADALAAVSGLPWQYNGQFAEQLGGDYWDRSGSDWKGIIASKGAAYDLLAHIEAWRGNYLDAASFAKIAIDNKAQGSYDIVDVATLTNTTDGVFTAKAKDILFALPFEADFQESSLNGHIEQWSLAAPYGAKQKPDIYISSDSIIKIFTEPKDTRFSFDASGVATGNYFYGYGNAMPIFRKIMAYSISGADPLPNYQSSIVIFRFEELVLLNAEALYFLGSRTAAIDQLNSIRANRGLEELPEDFSGDLPAEILQERRRELLGEGWRWFDLVRFGKVADFSTLKQKDVDNGAVYWPIAKDVLKGNTQLQQNNFWKH